MASEVYDYEKETTVPLTFNLVSGVVDIDKAGNYILGYFTPNLAKNVKISPMDFRMIHINYPCISEEVCIKAGYREFINENGISVFIHNTKFIINDKGFYINAWERNPKEIPSRWIYDFTKEYSAKNSINWFDSVFKNYHKNNLPVTKFAKELEFTYGIEFETCIGNIPQRLCFRNGLIPLKDGSISGHEYATIPLDNTNISILHECTKTLRKYTEFNYDCSLHLHIGIPEQFVQPKVIYAMYILGLALENEFGSLFHSNIFTTEVYKNHRKSYCKRLPPDHIDFGSLYYHYSGNERDYSGRKISLFKNHPLNLEENRKWEMYTRYLWLNLLPLMFGNTKTIEFRIHTPSFNITKIQAWLFLCNAFVSYAIKNYTKLQDCNSTSTINFEHILKSTYNDNTIIKYVLSYIEERRKMVKNNLEKYNDSCGFFELVDDENFKEINIDGITTLI